MKKILLSLLVLFLSTAMMANESVTMSLAGKGVAQKDAAAQVSNLLGCARTEFVVVNERDDQMGMTHISLQQLFNGKPIKGAMIFVHCKGGAAVSLNGQYATDQELPQPVRAISKAKARSKAKAQKKANTEMVIIETKGGQMRWAYETVNMKKQLKVYVDAETGQIFRTVPFRHTAGDVQGTAQTLYMGTIPMTSLLTAEGDYVLFDEGRRIYTYDAAHWDTSLFNQAFGEDEEDEDPGWDDEDEDWDDEEPDWNGEDGDWNGEDGGWDEDPDWDEDEDDEQMPSPEEMAEMIQNVFASLVETSSELHSDSPDWTQKEARKIVLTDFNEEWAVENLDGQYLCAMVFDEDNQFKCASSFIDLEKEDLSEFGLPRSYTLNLYLPANPTDKIMLLNVIIGEEEDQPIILDTYSMADILEGEGIARKDPETFTCVIELQNGPWLDVHAGMQAVYDYYKNEFGRDSYDGCGTPIRQFVNVQDDEGEFSGMSTNAAAANMRSLIDAQMPGMGQYAFDFMFYGCGDDFYMPPVVGFDVLAHEYSHLVTSYNGNGGLEYQGESGALNEAFSDIMACAIGHHSGLDTNWFIGENVVTSYYGDCLRNMADPKNGPEKVGGQQPDTYGGEFWADPEDPEDNGGVHINSGVMNYWYYLLCEGGNGTNDLDYSYELDGIGMDKATNIAFNALLNYLSPLANYQEACDATVLVAKQLYGEADAIETADAWKAVGVEVTEGILTGIENVEMFENIDNLDKTFNLAGMPVSSDYKGVVIKNGQKIVRK